MGTVIKKISEKVEKYIHTEVPSSSLVLYRVLFGVLMLISTLRFIYLGWIEEQYVAPQYHFTYYGFEFVKPYSPEFVYALFGGLVLTALCIMLGLFYRVAVILFFLLFTYIELLDKTYYLNHYYFVSIISLILCFLPANVKFSLDSLLRKRIYSDYVPRYSVDILKCMIAIVYIYAGIAKINSEWLFNAMPLSIWLPAQDDFPLIGSLFRERWVAYLFSWMGMLFDCTIPFLLMWKKSRIPAFAAVIIFHGITGYFFQIGVFPLVMTLSVIIFFDSNVHEKILGLFLRNNTSSAKTHYSQRIYKPIPIVLAFILIAQLIIPWRYLLYTGNRFWTEEGYRFGWRVMLMEKSGSATFYVKDAKTGKEGIVVNSEFLNRHQEKQMSMQPDMIVQFAHFLAKHYEKRGVSMPSVRAEVYATLNGRPSRLLIDSTVDLTQYNDDFLEKKWILDYKD